jgi:hypothetical protein
MKMLITMSILCGLSFGPNIYAQIEGKQGASYLSTFKQNDDPTLLNKALQELANAEKNIPPKGQLDKELTTIISRGAPDRSDPPKSKSNVVSQFLRLIVLGGDANLRAPNGRSPLIWAVEVGRYEVASARLLKFLLDHGAILAPQPGDSRNLIDSIVGDVHDTDVEALNFALQNGYPVNTPNAAGLTPLMFAARHGKTEAVKTLLVYGADAQFKNGKGQTAASLLDDWGKESGSQEFYEGHLAEVKNTARKVHGLLEAIPSLPNAKAFVALVAADFEGYGPIVVNDIVPNPAQVGTYLALLSARANRSMSPRFKNFASLYGYKAELLLVKNDGKKPALVQKSEVAAKFDACASAPSVENFSVDAYSADFKLDLADYRFSESQKGVGVRVHIEPPQGSGYSAQADKLQVFEAKESKLRKIFDEYVVDEGSNPAERVLRNFVLVVNKNQKVQGHYTWQLNGSQTSFSKYKAKTTKLPPRKFTWDQRKGYLGQRYEPAFRMLGAINCDEVK